MLTHKGTQTIETSRLILRRAIREDAEPMFRNWASDPEVTKFLTWPAHSDIAVSEMVIGSWLQEYEKDSYYQWMIELKEIGQPIGSISVVRQNDRVEEAEIGYCIAARHDPNNPHSGGVMRKCGMKYEGTNRACDRNNQGICDAAQYAMTRSDWEIPRYEKDEFDTSDDTSIVQEVYRRFDESSRLTKSKAARVEFLTTVKYIEKYLTSGARILDVGAGAGEYSLHFARKGYQVSALELADANIAAFRAKITADDQIDLVQGNALDLSRYDSDSFDVVLLFGPLYHLHDEADKLQCIEEAKRVCKPDGRIFFAFISNDIVILTMQQFQTDYLVSGHYNKDTFRLDDFPFVFHTVDHCRALLAKAGIQITHEVAADGVSELLKDLVNTMDTATYQQYLRYHFYICEKPECLGMSNHLLFVGKKE